MEVFSVSCVHSKTGNLKNFDGIQLFIAKGREPTHCIISFLLGQKNFLSTEWVDYVEEPMIYQALMHHFGSVGGWLEGSWGGWGGVGGKRSSWFTVIICLVVSPNCQNITWGASQGPSDAKLSSNKIIK